MRTPILALAGLLLAAAPTWAHHAFAAEFDSTKKIKLQGKVTKMEWINPHTWIHIEVINAEGKPEEWMVEGGTPNVLLRRASLRIRWKSGPRSLWMATWPRTATGSGPPASASPSRTASGCFWADRIPTTLPIASNRR